MTIEYGVAIKAKALRHAIMAWSASRTCLPHQQFSHEYEHHKSISYQTLIAKLGTPDALEPSDIFATLLLAWIQKLDSPKEATIHINGCSLILNHLSRNPKTNAQSTFFVKMKPFVWEMLKVAETIARSEIKFKSKNSFTELVQCFTNLPWTLAAARQPRRTDRIRGLYVYIYRLFVTTIGCLRSVISRDLNGDHSVNRSEDVEKIRQHIRIHLNDSEFQCTLALLLYPSGPQNDTCDPVRARFFRAKLLAIELLLIALEGPVISSLQSSKATEISLKLLFGLQARELEGFRMQQWSTGDFCLLLMVSGLALPSEAVTDGIPSWLLNVLIAAQWILSELEVRSCKKLALLLNEWWRERTLLGFLDIVDALWESR
jgi:hypothetical protein